MTQQRKNDQSPQPDESKVQGEGDYEAGRRYDEKTRAYVKSHDVERAAREAQPDSPAEEVELEQAEAKGKQRAKEEDSLLDDPDRVEHPTGESSSESSSKKGGAAR